MTPVHPFYLFALYSSLSLSQLMNFILFFYFFSFIHLFLRVVSNAKQAVKLHNLQWLRSRCEFKME